LLIHKERGITHHNSRQVMQNFSSA